MIPRRVAFLAALASLLPGCIRSAPEGDAATTSPATEAHAEALSGRAPDFKTIEKGDQSRHGAIEGPGLVIDDNETWARFWRDHTSIQGSDPPAVNFSSHFVAAMLLGQQPSTGYSISVEEVAKAGEEYTVAFGKGRPGPGCPVAAVITHPFHVAKIDRLRSDPPTVAFDDRGWTEHACG